MELLDGSVTYTAIALFGITSSFHCVGMCGGIVAAQCAGAEKNYTPIAKYCIGRILAYTVTGLIIGLIGEMLSINTYLKILIELLCGIVTLFIGLKTVGLFKWVTVGGTACPVKLENRFSPFITGVLTALLPCITLQAVQSSALASGSAVSGALIMLIFAVTSSPALAAVGVLAKLFTAKHRVIITKLSALFIIVMAVRMIIKAIKLLSSIT